MLSVFFFILLHPKNIFTYNVGNYSHPHIKEKTSFDVPHMFFNFVNVQILLFVAVTVPHQGCFDTKHQMLLFYNEGLAKKSHNVKNQNLYFNL